MKKAVMKKIWSRGPKATFNFYDPYLIARFLKMHKDVIRQLTKKKKINKSFDKK